MITCEAKQARERILEQQIIEQIEAALEIKNVEAVVAVGLRAVKGIGFYLVEFQEVTRATFKRSNPLIPVSEVVYTLKPSLKGI